MLAGIGHTMGMRTLVVYPVRLYTVYTVPYILNIHWISTPCTQAIHRKYPSYAIENT